MKISRVHRAILWLLSFLLFFTFSCSSSEDNNTPTPFVKLTPDELTFEGFAGNDTVVVSSSGAWSINGLPDWIDVSSHNGFNGDTLIVYVEKNLEEGDRNATIEVNTEDGDATAMLTVHQYMYIETDYVDLGFSNPGVSYNYNSNSGSLTVTYSTGTPPLVAAGKAIVLPSEHGYDIRVIDNTTTQGNSISMQTSQGDMSDLFRNISFTLSTNPSSPTRSSDGHRIFTPESYGYTDENGKYHEIYNAKTRATYTESCNLWSFEQSFAGAELYSGAAGKLYWDECRYYATLNGEFTFDFGEKSINQVRKKGDIKRFAYTLTGNVGLDMQLHYNMNAEYSEEDDTIIKKKLHQTLTIPFRVGLVPICINVDTHLGKYTNFEAEGNVDATAGLHANYMVESGMEWTPQGGAQPHYNATPTLELLPFTIEAQASLEAKVSYYPRIDIRIYKFLGPWVEPRPYLKESVAAGLYASSDGSEDIGWKSETYNGMDLRLGLDATFLGWRGNLWTSQTYNPMKDKLLFEAPSRISKISPQDGIEVEEGESVDAEFLVECYSPLNDKYYPCPLALVNFEQECGEVDGEIAVADVNGKVRVKWTPQPKDEEQAQLSATRAEKMVERELKAKIVDKDGEVINEDALTVKVEDDSACDDENHVHAVDLGLSVKWACCNIGASSPEEYGGYYAWGETEEKSNYTAQTYKYWTDKDGDGYYDYDEGTISSDISGTQYDVAHVKWGGSWRMPTRTEIQELVNNCTWEWTTVNGVNGYRVTGSNGNSIFLPAAGCRYGTGVYNTGGSGGYWSSTPGESSSYGAYVLGFGYNGGNYWSHWSYRDYGHSVRPVSE